jgi:hypothetical protein
MCRGRSWSSCSATATTRWPTFDQKAGRVRDIGVTQAMYSAVFMAALLLTASLATALVYGWGGVLSVHHVLVGRLVWWRSPPT